MSDRTPATAPVRVVIADDQALVRSGFRLILERRGVEVVAEACDGLEAIEAARETRPDVVLMDIRMPRLDGLEATRRITGGGAAAAAGEPPPRVLVLTTFDLDEYVYEALRAGASGFLLKDAGADDLVSAVRVVTAGEALLAPSVTRRLIERFAREGAPTGDAPGDVPREAAPAPVEALTEREQEVLRLLARGLSNLEIAGALTIGEPTVKTHVAHLLAKLGLRNRVQAVVYAYERGIVRPGDAG